MQFYSVRHKLDFIIRVYHSLFCHIAILFFPFNFDIILFPSSLSVGCGTGCLRFLEPSVPHKLPLLWLLN